MNTVPFRPNKSRYLVLPDPVEAKSESIGAYRIEQEKDQHQPPSEGVVVACGAFCSEFTRGAKVLYGKYSGYEQTFDGIQYKILQEDEILGERIVTPFDDKETVDSMLSTNPHDSRASDVMYLPDRE